MALAGALLVCPSAGASAAAVTSYALFTALMGSPAHSEIIHDGRYRQVGVGLERGTSTDDGGLTVTLDFGVITARR